MTPWHFSDSSFLNYSNITANNLSSTLQLTQHRLSPCRYKCLIWVLVGETFTLGLSDEIILCQDGQKITKNSSVKTYVVWRKKRDRHVDYLKLKLQVSKLSGHSELTCHWMHGSGNVMLGEYEWDIETPISIFLTLTPSKWFNPSLREPHI